MMMSKRNDNNDGNSGRVQIGCQGWNYDDWTTGPASGEGVFYPRGTRAAQMLPLYARVFGSVEVDSTFYAVPAAAIVDGWHKRTPPGFTFALKLPQAITHEFGLRRGSADLLAEFCDHARLLQDKLAAVLVQLPPQFEADDENLRALRDFLPRLPQDIKFAVEFRHRSWLQAEVSEWLARHNVAFAFVEGQWFARDEVWQLVEHPTADFAYVRWMGARDLTRFDIVQRPQADNLRLWAQALTQISTRLPNVYAYFSNYYEGHAPASANRLKRQLGQSVVEPGTLEDQPSLF